MGEVMNSKCESILEYSGKANFQTSNTVVSKQQDEDIIIVEDEDAFLYQESTIGKYSIFEVANWFLLKKAMTQKKLQKLCYYAQAWCYALKDYRLADSDFQAWIHGPASPVLYEKFKSFGFDTIEIKNVTNTKIEQEDQLLLEDIWETYGNYTGNALEALSHRETPWIQARIGYAPDERCSIIISPEAMKTYYRSIYKK